MKEIILIILCFNFYLCFSQETKMRIDMTIQQAEKELDSGNCKEEIVKWYDKVTNDWKYNHQEMSKLNYDLILGGGLLDDFFKYKNFKTKIIVRITYMYSYRVLFIQMYREK